MDSKIASAYSEIDSHHRIGDFAGRGLTFDPHACIYEIGSIVANISFPNFFVVGIGISFPVSKSFFLKCKECDSLLAWALDAPGSPECLACTPRQSGARPAKDALPLPNHSDRYSRSDRTYSHVLGPYRRIGNDGRKYLLACEVCSSRLSISQPALAQRRHTLTCPNCSK